MLRPGFTERLTLSPNEGMRHSVKNGLLLVLFLGLFLGLVGRSVGGLVGGLVGGFVGGLLAGLGAAIQHYTAPYYVKFLTISVQRNVNVGSWRIEL